MSMGKFIYQVTQIIEAMEKLGKTIEEDEETKQFFIEHFSYKPGEKPAGWVMDYIDEYYF